MTVAALRCRRALRRITMALAVWCAPAAIAHAQEIRAGAAYERFDLPSGVPLAGYSRREGRPSSGLHDPVGVRAVAMEHDGRIVVLASCDLLIVDERLAEAVQGRLAVSLPGAVLLIAATHTHSGPGAWGTKFLEKVSMGHYDAGVFERLVDAISRAALQAHARLEPAGMVCDTARLEGWSHNRVEEAGPVDADVPVCTLRRAADAQPIAVLTGFAAHPTTLGASNMALSGDYPGVAARAVEARFPAAVCLFFAGAVADQGPVKSGNGFDAAERLGEALAAPVIAAVERGQAAPLRELHAAQERMRLAPATVRFGKKRVPAWLGRRLVDDDATLTVVRAGPLALFGVPCDLAAPLGGELKAAARADGLVPIIAGFGSDYIGYCMPEALYRTDHYEAQMMLNGPATGPAIIRQLIAMFKDLEPDPS